MLLRFDGEVKAVMEATGIYHLPVLTYLQGKGIFVAVIFAEQFWHYDKITKLQK